MSVEARGKLMAYDVLEAITEGKVPGLTVDLVKHGDILIETEAKDAGGFITSCTWRHNFSITFYGRGVSSSPKVVDLLNKALPGLELRYM